MDAVDTIMVGPLMFGPPRRYEGKEVRTNNQGVWLEYADEIYAMHCGDAVGYGKTPEGAREELIAFARAAAEIGQHMYEHVRFRCA